MKSFSMARTNGPLAAALLVALVAGLWLRCFQIGDQILMDDEVNSIVKLASSDYRGIFLSFGREDYSIPMTLFFKWLEAKGRLSEAWMLAPSVVFGSAACIFAVAVVRRGFPVLTVALLAALLAASPLLVLYARQARPYAITLFLVLVAMWSAYRWMSDRHVWQAALYAICAAVAAWLHVILVPIVVAPWLYFLARWVRGGRKDAAMLRAIAIAAGSALALMIALLAPPFVEDWQSLRAKTGHELPTLASTARTVLMLEGTGQAMLGAAIALLAALGARQLWRDHPGPTRYVGCVLALHTAAIVLSGAVWLSHPLILSRYLLVLVPFLLFAAAVGFETLIARAAAAWVHWAVAALFVAATFASGPLPAVLGHPNAFVQHKMYFVDFDPEHNPELPYLRAGPIPDFYRELGKLPPRSKVIIEAPWRFESMFNRLALFQEIHRQRVQIGMVGALCPPGAFLEQPRYLHHRFRHFIDLSQPVESLRRQADYVIFHRKLDMGNMIEPWQSYGGQGLPPVDACIAAFVKSVGTPVFQDETVTVFQLRP